MIYQNIIRGHSIASIQINVHIFDPKQGAGSILTIFSVRVYSLHELCAQEWMCGCQTYLPADRARVVCGDLYKTLTCTFCLNMSPLPPPPSSQILLTSPVQLLHPVDCSQSFWMSMQIVCCTKILFSLKDIKLSNTVASFLIDAAYSDFNACLLIWLGQARVAFCHRFMHFNTS